MAQLMPLPLIVSCLSKSQIGFKARLVLPFWYRLTRVVPDKGPLNGCVYCIVFSAIQPLKAASVLKKTSCQYQLSKKRANALVCRYGLAGTSRLDCDWDITAIDVTGCCCCCCDVRASSAAVNTAG